MKISTMFRLATCAMATTLAIVGCTPGGQVQSASHKGPSDAKAAAQFAAMGEAAIRRHDGSMAIAMAERAVSAQPKDARYRAQLGQSYLLGGRFASAVDAFRDAAVLTPRDGRILLGMALADAALDRTAAARAAVAAAQGHIPEPDRGLALALAGDADAAILILEPVARATDATAKTRQNLALAYALAGRWDVARATAAQDLAPAELEARMAKWAKLAAPQARVDRVAAFLGVNAAAMDGGMPVQLALGGMPERAVPTPVEMPVAVAAADPVPVPEAEADVPVTVAMQTEVVPEVAPAPVVRAPMLVRAAYAVPKRGTWAVQLGAFSSGRSIEVAWDKLRRTVRPVAGMVPLSSTVRTGGQMFQRLAVGGIGSRAEAISLCEQVRAAGGVCFVRSNAGMDAAPVRMAGARGPVRIAAR